MKKYFFIGCIGITLGLLVSYFIAESAANIAAFTAVNYSLFALLGIAISYFIYFSGLKLNKIVPYHKQESLRLFLGIGTHYLIALATIFICFFFANRLFLLIPDFFTTYLSEFIKVGIIVFILILFFEIIYFALYSYYSYTTFQIETVRQERKQIELQLKALKGQLSPHFLFNSLNTISSLVYKNETKAELFIRKLAQMYQYTLGSYQKKLITLEEELNFVNSYLYLLQTRFENKVSCTIEIDEELNETKIPPLTLQMLLENAVKHNVLSEENPLRINIVSDKKSITVTNNITEIPKKVTSFQIGLKNINARYLLLHDRGISITNGSAFTVKIPVIR